MSNTLEARPSTLPSTLSDDEVESLLVKGTAEQSAYMAWWLAVLVEFDRRQLWGGWGIMSCAHWLSLKCGLSGRTAREHVRVAHALEALPETRAAFAEGRLSYSKVRVLTRVAKPDNEPFLVGLAMDLTASKLEQHIASYELTQRPPLTAEDDARRRAECGVTTWIDARGLKHHEIVTPPEEGLIIDRAIEKGWAEIHKAQRAAAKEAKAQGREPEPVPRLTGAQRKFEGLVWACRHGLANAERNPYPVDDPFLIVIHMKEGAAAVDERGNIDLGNGLVVSPPTFQRLCCNSMVQAMMTGSDDRPLDLGRATRTATPKQKIALSALFDACVFPGCETPIRYCQFHHLKYWDRDCGRTDLENLRPLCYRHHHLMHEGGWQLVIDDKGLVMAVSPTGRRVASNEPLTDEAVSRHALRARLDAMGFDPDDPDRADQLAGRWGAEKIDEWTAQEIAFGLWQAIKEPDSMVGNNNTDRYYKLSTDPPSMN
jgi:hypothetical protein